MMKHPGILTLVAGALLPLGAALAQHGPIEPGAPDATGAAELQRVFFLYKGAVEDGMYGEADSLAKRVIELSIDQHGLDSHEAAIALTNLAVVQHKQDDYESAQANYQAAIEIVERIEDRLHSSLVPPLKGLGASQLSSGRPDLARLTFDRAVHVTHVNDGPHNLMQIPVLDALAATYMSVGEFDDAEDIQKRIYYLQMRDVELDSEGAIAALQKQADWSHRLRLFEKERKSYRQMIRILERSRGAMDLSLIDPLTRLGNSYLYGASRDSEYVGESRIYAGDDFLQRALEIADTHPDSTWRTRSDAMLALADYYNLIGKTPEANEIYVEVWELLSDDAERLEERHRQLETTNYVRQSRMPRFYNNRAKDFGRARASDFRTGTIVAAYSVTLDGRPENIRIIDAKPKGLSDMEYRVRRQIGRMVHRPRIADGAVIMVDDITYSHDFLYREKDLPQPQRIDMVAEQSEEPH